MEKRKVKIELAKNTWIVLYEDRKKGQWYSAAQFYAPDHTLKEVEGWVKKQPKIELSKVKK